MSETRVPEKHYSIAEAADRAGLSTATIQRAIAATDGLTLRAKRKPGRDGKPGRGYLIPASALAEFLEGLDDA